jgi:hypothetical protein
VRKRLLFTRQVMLMYSGFGRPLRHEAVAEPAAPGDGQKRAAPERQRSAANLTRHTKGKGRCLSQF